MFNLTTANVLLIIYLLWNFWCFLVMGWDKRRARTGQWRVKENSLFYLALAMGALGILLGMKAFHHKTRHRKFVYGIPALFILNSIIILSIFFKWEYDLNIISVIIDKLRVLF